MWNIIDINTHEALQVSNCNLFCTEQIYFHYSKYKRQGTGYTAPGVAHLYDMRPGICVLLYFNQLVYDDNAWPGIQRYM